MADDSTQPPASEPPSSGGGLDLGVIGGLVLAFGGIIGGLYLEGSSVGKYIGPSAALIVFGGTFGVTMTSQGLTRFKKLPSAFLSAVKHVPPNNTASIQTLVEMAAKARREGMLVLENGLRLEPDEFLRNGMQLVVDGTDVELVQDIMFNQIDSFRTEDMKNSKMFEAMATFAPAIGIIGTVIGLVLVLSNITDPASLAGAIAVAFIATLYGVGSANLVYLPISMKLQSNAKEDAAARVLIMEGILSIGGGDNPSIVKEKLISHLAPAERIAYRASMESDSDFELG